MADKDSEHELGVGLFYESINNGRDHRIIGQDGENYFMTSSFIGDAKIGDIGRIVDYSDGISFGLTKFIPDATVQIDLETLKNNYNKKWDVKITPIKKPQKKKKQIKISLASLVQIVSILGVLGVLISAFQSLKNIKSFNPTRVTISM